MMRTSPFERAAGETLVAWLARLEAIAPEGLSVHTLSVLRCRAEVIRSALKRAETTASPAPDPVEQAKESYRRLAPGQRQQFTRWLSEGAP